MKAKSIKLSVHELEVDGRMMGALPTRAALRLEEQQADFLLLN
jgi:hypothetical protein